MSTMSDTKPARPEIGATTTKTIDIPVCKMCGYVVGETGMCSDHCSEDGERRSSDNTFRAVYERAETFKGDEEYTR